MLKRWDSFLEYIKRPPWELSKLMWNLKGSLRKEESKGETFNFYLRINIDLWKC